MKLGTTVVGHFIVSTANGLFLIEDGNLYELLEGNFYGVTLWDNNIVAYKTYGHKGKIIQFPNNGRFDGQKCDSILFGLPHGCHQIDCLGDSLYITDTYNNRIIKFGLHDFQISNFYPLGILIQGRSSPNYAHLNSIFFYGEDAFIYCHNESTKTNRKSRILMADENFEKKGFLKTNSRNGHNVVFFEGHYYHCDSMGRSLKRDNEIVFQSAHLTRGLSITNEYIVVGGSDFAEREKRSQTKGYLYFLTHEFDLHYECALPGPVHEIRKLDGIDYSLSNTNYVNTPLKNL